MTHLSPYAFDSNPMSFTQIYLNWKRWRLCDQDTRQSNGIHEYTLLKSSIVGITRQFNLTRSCIKITHSNCTLFTWLIYIRFNFTVIGSKHYKNPTRYIIYYKLNASINNATLRVCWKKKLIMSKIQSQHL